MPAIARQGDTSTHGGTVSVGSPNMMVNNRPVARVGDVFICPTHGPQTIVSSPISGKTNQGKLLAVVGSNISCGAVITTGSPNTNAN